jgi:DMSO/TMAO reductase YedYZ molybdopterin-dependent catalytic subunit
LRVDYMAPAHKGRSEGNGRRLFLKVAGWAAFAAAVPSWVRAYFVDKLQVRTVEGETFRFNPETGSIHWTDKHSDEPYYLTINGLVETPLKLTYADLKAFPQARQVSDFHCVEGWSVKEIHWGGFRFSEIMRKVKTKPGATYVVFHALGKTGSPAGGLDHYVESFSIEELVDPKKECLLALSLDGKPLTHDHGAPLRVVSPYDLGYKSSKFVTRVEFSKKREPGWWTLANPIYPSEAPVPKSRLRQQKG